MNTTSVFEYNLAEPPKIYENGRLISITLQKHNDENVTILCTYGVAGTDNNRKYKDGITKGETKKRLKEAASTERNRIYKEFGPTPIILMGDLQDGPEDKGNKKDSLCKWAVDKKGPGMRSHGYDNKGEAQYESFRAASGATSAIDHIMTDHLSRPMINNFFVDDQQYMTCGGSGSDHHLLAASVDFGFQSQRASTPSVTVQNYKTLSSIRMDITCKEDEESGKKEFIYSMHIPSRKTEKFKEAQDTYALIQETFSPQSYQTM